MTNNAIEKVSYSHDGMIDVILANPSITNRQLALRFGYTEVWISRVKSSDAFKARLAERKKELVDPILVETIEHKLDATINQGLDILQEKMEQTRDPELASKVVDITLKARGFGARVQQGPVINQQFVVAMPPAVDSVDAWQAQHQQLATPVTPAEEQK